MSDNEYTVILVSSTSHAIRLEKVLGSANIACKLVPVPRHLSSDCGVCVRIRRRDRDEALCAIQACQATFESVCDI
jgi:hypothetical protein